MSVNKVILLGNVGKDPEIRRIDNNTAVARFSLATSESYKKGDTWTEVTEWHNIVMWRGLAERAEKYVRKGRQLYIEGKIQTRSYEKDGEKRYITEIVANTMVLIGRRDEQGGESTPSSDSFDVPYTKPDISSQEETDDLPF